MAEYNRKRYAEKMHAKWEIQRKWREANPEKVREIGQKLAAQRLESRKKRIECQREYARKWTAANPEKVRESERKSCMRKSRNDKFFQMLAFASATQTKETGQ